MPIAEKVAGKYFGHTYPY